MWEPLLPQGQSQVVSPAPSSGGRRLARGWAGAGTPRSRAVPSHGNLSRARSRGARVASMPRIVPSLSFCWEQQVSTSGPHSGPWPKQKGIEASVGSQQCPQFPTTAGK